MVHISHLRDEHSRHGEDFRVLGSQAKVTGTGRMRTVVVPYRPTVK